MNLPMEVTLKEFTTSNSVNPLDFQAIKISLASADEIRNWSHGEVKTSETINYRTFKPERDGLFCGRIFGPINDYECICGKYKRMKHRSITCEKCGVEVIESKVRRERMGHIELACPVSHIWFLKGLPSRMAILLDMTLHALERVIYFDAYIVIEPGSSGLQAMDIVEENEHFQLENEYDDYYAGIGAEAIKELLSALDIQKISEELRVELAETTSEAKRKKIIKQLKVVDSFYHSGIDPANMILDVLPVISPDLRPLVSLEGGRFASSDLNDLYRRVIHRNTRLKRLIELNAPDIIVKNEKRMLQESVDALFDNGRRGRPILSGNKRPLKSLSDSLKGKSGRFRQNLLGKRVDYSGRSVIVVGPDLKLTQCGLPKKMALELFKPFIFKYLIEQGQANSIKNAKTMVEQSHEDIWAALDAVIIDHPVLLNRAPTLHRLGIQAFEPVLTEGKAITLHPLVCAAFNADFDGDQMAVHVPLTIEARLEAKILIMGVNNLLSPATGLPVMLPSQDMILGIYWVTKETKGSKGEGKVFGSVDMALYAYEYQGIDLQARIKVKLLPDSDFVETTTGRVLLYNIVPKEVDFSRINRLLKKKDIEQLIDDTYRAAGSAKTARMLDAMKNMGFYHAMRAGFSIAMKDMVIPSNKEELLGKGMKEVEVVQEQYDNGVITDGERYNKVIDIWSRVTNEVGRSMKEAMSEEIKNDKGLYLPNPIFVMSDSGARGSEHQSRQLGGMRGLMAKPSGEIIETPIKANFREGLSVQDYFFSTHGARKGLADTALKTANSGYLTRRLTDVAQDTVITMKDCGTLDSIVVESLLENGEVIVPLRERILGRIVAEDIFDIATNELLIKEGTLIVEKHLPIIEEQGLEKLAMRSVLTCESKKGVCAHCYGRDLVTGELIQTGVAIGVIAAQSIGEPGTQLTMRTFHIGGAASRKVEETSWEVRFSGTLQYEQSYTVTNKQQQEVVQSRKVEAVIIDKNGREVDRYLLPIGSIISYKNGAKVTKGDTVAVWDPFSQPTIVDVHCFISYSGIEKDKNLKIQRLEEMSKERRVIVESSHISLKPHLDLRDADGNPILREDDKEHRGFDLPIGAELMVGENEEVFPGDVLARLPREATKNKDITGGLPRVGELVEARSLKDVSQISDVDGIVSFGDDIRRSRRIIVTPEVGEPREYLIPRTKQVLVMEGHFVRAGEALTDGALDPHAILRVKGVKELHKFLVNEVQSVYCLQGVKINDKHIELIVRQMLRKIQVIKPGDSTLLVGEIIDKNVIAQMNEELRLEGKNLIVTEPILLGITKAALSTESFMSAASFQETTKILTEAAIEGKVDTFEGLKENVIMGRLIPAGTGLHSDWYYGYSIYGDEENQEDSMQSEIETVNNAE